MSDNAPSSGDQQDPAADRAEHRAALEEQMYWSRHDGTPAERRRQLEQDWNAVRKEQIEARDPGIKEEAFQYKYDRRDDFVLTEHKDSSGSRIVTASGPVHDPSTTINWRSDTEIGNKREARLRKKISGGTGDDAGHLIKAQYGADPEGVNACEVDPKAPDNLAPDRRLNFRCQNRAMNQRVTYKQTEDAITNRVRDLAARDAHLPPEERRRVDLELRSKTSPRSFDGGRELDSQMIVKEGVPGKPNTYEKSPLTMKVNGKQTTFHADDSLHYLNADSNERRLAQAKATAARKPAEDVKRDASGVSVNRKDSPASRKPANDDVSTRKPRSR